MAPSDPPIWVERVGSSALGGRAHRERELKPLVGDSTAVPAAATYALSGVGPIVSLRLQISGIEALCEPTIHGREQLAPSARRPAPPTAALDLSQAQFEGLCLPLARPLKHLLERRLRVVRTPLHEEPQP